MRCTFGVIFPPPPRVRNTHLALSVLSFESDKAVGTSVPRGRTRDERDFRRGRKVPPPARNGVRMRMYTPGGVSAGGVRRRVWFERIAPCATAKARFCGSKSKPPWETRSRHRFTARNRGQNEVTSFGLWCVCSILHLALAAKAPRYTLFWPFLNTKYSLSCGRRLPAPIFNASAFSGRVRCCAYIHTEKDYH